MAQKDGPYLLLRTNDRHGRKRWEINFVGRDGSHPVNYSDNDDLRLAYLLRGSCNLRAL